jgi:hypothetical protein
VRQERKGPFVLNRLARGAAACALIACVLPAAIATSYDKPTREDQLRATQLLSRAPDGSVPNAPVSQPVISQDERIARYAAYVTAATNIVSGSGGARNVYLVSRKGPWGKNGTAWHAGATTLVSRGLNGAPANGDSFGPVLTGSDYINPHCMAFVSAASNLVAGDTNGRADVFFRKLPTGKLTRIAGRGPVTEVSVDGVCKHVAFVAGGKLYVKTLGDGTKAVPGAGVTKPQLAVDGRLVTFERGGWIYAKTLRTGKLHRIAQGANHSSDFYGRYVTFVRGTSILRAEINGPARVRTIPQAGGGLVAGNDPDMTGGGGWVWYAKGSNLEVNIRKRDQGRCKNEEPLSAPDSSPHGNYVVFICGDGPAYLLYEGGK